MSRQKGVDNKIQVTRGFVTEFTPVAFPQEAAIDLDNVIIDSDGSVRRRPGLDLEPGYQLNSVDGGGLVTSELETHGFSTNLWTAVANSGTLNIIVVQMGLILHFYAQFGTLSANLLGEMDLTPYAVEANLAKKESIQVASGLGKLYVVGKYIEPIKITYDGGTFSSEQIFIRIRDFEGLEDSLQTEERPSILTREHYYNLRNQGWTEDNINSFAGIGGSTNLCGSTSIGLGVAGSPDFPSNADTMTIGIITNGSGNLEFDGDFIREDWLGNTPSAKGHFILDAFNQDRSVALDCGGTGAVIFPTRPSAVAFQNGRVYYTSPTTQDVISGIYYSQQLTQPDRDGNCFQEADPTASEINDLIDTDGGVLPAPGVGEIYSLREFGNGIVVFASNGIWYVTGADEGSSISATNIRLQKISTIAPISDSTVVEAEGSLFYMGIDGIIQIQQAELGGLVAQSITNDSIQGFYVSISADSRKKATGVYIPEQRKIYWAYRDSFADTNADGRGYNRYLVLDFEIKGFYKYSVAEYDDIIYPEVMGLTLVAPLTAGSVVLPLTELDGSSVTELDGITVIGENSTGDTGQITQLKLAVMAWDTGTASYKPTFATFHSRAFTEWYTISPYTEIRAIDGAVIKGVPMASYCEFAEFNMGAPHTKGTPTYVHSFFEKTTKNLEPGGYWELPPLPELVTCTSVADVVLIVDNTGSQNIIDYPITVTPAIGNMIQSWIDLEYDMTLGLVALRATSVLEQSITADMASIKTAVLAFPAPTGRTDLAGSINVAAAELALNARAGVQKVIVIITDGASNQPDDITAFGLAEIAAQTARDADIRIVIFGVLGIDNSNQVGGGGG